MKTSIAKLFSAAAMMMIATQSLAAVSCVLSDFRIDAYDHAGTYLHGNLNGSWLSFINICGQAGSAQDCASKATDRRLAIALSAQAQGKSLLLYFWNETSCSQVTPYTIVASMQLAP